MSSLIKIYSNIFKLDCEKAKRTKQAVKGVPETSIVLSRPIKNLLEFLTSRQSTTAIK